MSPPTTSTAVTAVLTPAGAEAEASMRTSSSVSIASQSHRFLICFYSNRINRSNTRYLLQDDLVDRPGHFFEGCGCGHLYFVVGVDGY